MVDEPKFSDLFWVTVILGAIVVGVAATFGLIIAWVRL